MADSKIPREMIPWFPKIDYEKCTKCKTCVEFCSHKVYTWDEKEKIPKVTNPYGCVVGCTGCAQNACKNGAIIFPTLEQCKKMIDEARKKLQEGK